MRVIWQHNSMEQCATTPAKLHAQFHFGSFYTAFRKQGSSTGEDGEPWRPGQGGRAEEAGREGVSVGSCHEGEPWKMDCHGSLS